MTEIYARMVQIIGDSEDWQTSGTVLRRGELAVEMASPVRLRLGDGLSALDQLPSIAFSSGSGMDPDIVTALAAKADKSITLSVGPFLAGGGSLGTDLAVGMVPTCNGWGTRYVETVGPSAGVGEDGDIWYMI